MALTIRSKQKQALKAQHIARFQDRLLAHLRKHHRARLESSDDGQVKAYIVTCQTRAATIYRLTTEQALACYAQIPLLLGDGFEINPKYRTVVDLLGIQSFDQNIRAKMALASAYWVFERSPELQRAASAASDRRG